MLMNTNSKRTLFYIRDAYSESVQILSVLNIGASLDDLALIFLSTLINKDLASRHDGHGTVENQLI